MVALTSLVMLGIGYMDTVKLLIEASAASIRTKFFERVLVHVRRMPDCP